MSSKAYVHLPRFNQNIAKHPLPLRYRDKARATEIGMKYTTVLVVDDSVTIRAMLQVLLERDAHLRIVGIASNAQQSFQLIKEVDPDVVTLDIAMPDMDGFSLLRSIRALGVARGGNLPAVALTAFARPEDRTQALRAGFAAHLTKPVEPPELLATVAGIAGRSVLT